MQILLYSVLLKKKNVYEFKKKWEITKNWQLIFPLLGILAVLLSGYLIATLILTKSNINNVALLSFLSFFIAYLLLNLTLKIFIKLEKRWKINYRWEIIAIFLVFSITGSVSARVSIPISEYLGFQQIEYKTLLWILRLILIYPIYILLLIAFGWLFGQFNFFWEFKKKMLKRIGFKRFFKN